MFIETTTNKAATVTWFVINTIVLVFCSRRKRFNEYKQYMQIFFLVLS